MTRNNPTQTETGPGEGWAVPDLRRLTVVIPTYNRRESLRRCLAGLFACELQDLQVEVHVVDDGSRDGTADVIAAAQQAAPPQVRLVAHRQENQGPGAARNLAIGAATTDVVVFLDDDCVPEPGWLQAIARTRWPPDVAAVGGRIVSPESGNWVARYCRHLRYNEFPPVDKPLDFVDTANCAYLRRVLREIGGLEPLVSGGGEAHDLARRVCALGYRLAYQPDAVVLHYHRETVPALLRAFYRRGYRGRYRAMLSGWRALPTLASVACQGWRLCGYPLRLLRLPRRLAALAVAGVPREDRIRFALLTWLVGYARAAGEFALAVDVLRGRQPVSRTRATPQEAFEGEAPVVSAVAAPEGGGGAVESDNARA